MLWDTIRLNLLFSAVHLAHGLDTMLDNSCFMRSQPRLYERMLFVHIHTHTLCILSVSCVHIFLHIDYCIRWCMLVHIHTFKLCSSHKNAGNISAHSSRMRRKKIRDNNLNNNNKNCGRWLVLFFLFCLFSFLIFFSICTGFLRI